MLVRGARGGHCVDDGMCRRVADPHMASRWLAVPGADLGELIEPRAHPTGAVRGDLTADDHHPPGVGPAPMGFQFAQQRDMERRRAARAGQPDNRAIWARGLDLKYFM
jgi:hypothetical protein